MIRLRELDENTTYLDQLHSDDEGPVVLINTFSVPLDAIDSFVAVWSGDAAFMQGKPGFISAQLHEGVGGSGTFIVTADWASVAHLRAAFTDPEFRARMANYPDGTVGAPHVFRRVEVSGVCPGAVGSESAKAGY